jgi:tol-pal system protein YbgF
MTRLYMLLALVLAVPAAAQPNDVAGVDRRVGKLESEMRAVQRKVFPGGDARYFEPEVQPAGPAAVDPVGTPASAPLTDLTARVGELEAQLRSLTGQVEANGYKITQLEAALTKFRGDAEFRLGALEGGARPADAGAAPAPAGEAVPPPAAAEAAPAPAAPVGVEGQWRAAYALVVAKDWANAEPALTDFIVANPKAARASDAQYWLGKTYAAQKAPAQAAKAFLDGYQKYPKGTRASASLLGLAQALIDLKKPDQACRSLGQLDTEFGAKLSADLKAQAAKARTAAKCTD